MKTKRILTFHAFSLAVFKSEEVIILSLVVVFCSINGADAEFFAAFWVRLVEEVPADLLILVAGGGLGRSGAGLSAPRRLLGGIRERRSLLNR